jgi:thiol-disulfide isomerase/thioredoxin
MQYALRISKHRSAVSFFLIAIAMTMAARAVAQSANSGGQLYFFTNAGCRPCRAVEPVVEQLYREGYPVMKIDTTMHPDWTQHFQVTSTPTVILVSDSRQVLARKSGYIDVDTLRSWFASLQPAGDKSQVDHQLGSADPRIAVPRPAGSQISQSPDNGTPHPANHAERRSLQATVRLKIEDPFGSSYATGTVIHTHENESLVLTCGHVFRDSKGKGKISVEYGFLDQQLKVAEGELLHFDSDARDIGLVAIATEQRIEPVPVANLENTVGKSDRAFSIGCDHGQSPTIRQTTIKSAAKYDGINKYEIVGRPVSGRSGGGLFTTDGRLIGVCNAAVVDADEGVYVALDTIHGELDLVNLSHLFLQESVGDAATNSENFVGVAQTLPNNSRGVAKNEVNTPSNIHARNNPDTLAFQSDLIAAIPKPAKLAEIPIRNPSAGTIKSAADLRFDANAISSVTNAANVNSASTNPSNSAFLAGNTTTNNVGDNQDHPTGSELILVLRNKKTGQPVSTWIVDNPSPEILDSLRQDDPKNKQTNPQDRFAQLRREMPNLQNAQSKIYNPLQNRSSFRAQSPN